MGYLGPLFEGSPEAFLTENCPKSAGISRAPRARGSQKWVILRGPGTPPGTPPGTGPGQGWFAYRHFLPIFGPGTPKNRYPPWAPGAHPPLYIRGIHGSRVPGTMDPGSPGPQIHGFWTGPETPPEAKITMTPRCLNTVSGQNLFQNHVIRIPRPISRDPCPDTESLRSTDQIHT